MPNRTIALTAARTRSGRDGVRIPAPASVRTTNTVEDSRSSAMVGMFASRLPGRQLEVGGGLPVVDEAVDVSGAAGIEVHVPLAHGGLLEQHAGRQQRLADLHGQGAVVAGEAARE